MSSVIDELFAKYNMSPENIDPIEIAYKVKEHMLSGINGNIIDIPMIPTYLSCNGSLKYGEKVIVIDAGGTNYRVGLASFDKFGCKIDNVYKCKMPGSDDTSATWDEFISFVVDSFEPFINESDKIGFCFSYSADIHSDHDGVVNVIDKEVVITGSENQPIGKSINKELVKRGYSPKKIVILNDSVAALMGGGFSLNLSDYSSISGVICGTGFNICLNYNGMIYNTEAGFFSDMPIGEADIRVDKKSNVPGEKIIEKMISGAYIGNICLEMLCLACAENIFSEKTCKNISELPEFKSSIADALTHKEDILELASCEDDLNMISEICINIFERSARSAASALIGVMLLEDKHTKPTCFCMEGSLISNSEQFKSFLIENMDKYAKDLLGFDYVISVGHDTTLPGSAFAALIN